MDKLKQFKLKRRIGMILVIALAAALLLFAVSFFFFRANRFSLVITPVGGQETELEYGHTYADPGAAVRLTGSLVFRSGIPVDAKVTVSDNILTDVLGDYEISYRAAWLLWEGTAKRKVQVVDRTPPVIHLHTVDSQLTEIGEAYVEEGYSAEDNCDGDLTEFVEAVEENGVVTYRVSDSSGNIAVVQRQIRYVDSTAPMLILAGGTVTVSAGDQYVEPGYTAWDNHDGDITDWVEIFSDYNQYLPGTYKMTYVVSDTGRNETVVEREIIVVPKDSWEMVLPEGKIIYLTFDDGPSEYTGKLLEILRRNEVPATFFVCEQDDMEILSDIAAQGHTVAIHSQTHDYEKIYASVEAYLADIFYMHERIYELTGVKTNLIRFPGGSSNTISQFNPGIMTTLSRTVQECGFCYFDWNVDSNDAGGARTAEEVFSNVTKGILLAMDQYGFAMVLQHDTREFSVDAVERIIQWGKDNGYTFLPLQENSPHMHHGINN